MQLNSGILQRRYENWDAAIAHFELARSIDTTYCEPGYWVGLCLINQGMHASRGMEVRAPPVLPHISPAQPFGCVSMIWKPLQLYELHVSWSC